jgi:hypothetical protein
VVALAAGGGLPVGGGGEVRAPTGAAVDYLIVFAGLVVLGFGAAVVYAFWPGLPATEELERRAAQRRRSRWTTVVVASLMPLGLAIAIASARDRFELVWPDRSGEDVTVADEGPASGGSGTIAGLDPTAVLVGAGILATAVVVVLAVVVRDRRRRAIGWEAELTLAETLADVLGESIDDLRSEGDPRVAVVAAYARMERALAAGGLPRRSFETPLEFLGRLLVQLEASTGSVGRLTELFERAAFSLHPIDESMRREAIGALEAVRYELQAA